MRNPDLDKKIPEDEKIGNVQNDKNGRKYKIINDKKIYQIEEKTKEDEDMNLIINRVRASGMSSWEYLNS